MAQTYQYPWYTHCTNYTDWKPWSVPVTSGVIAGLGLLGAPFLGPWGLIGVGIGAVAGFLAVASVFDWLLGGKLVCLGGGADQIVCGTVTHLEPPLDSIWSPTNMDNDYSWNMLLCPYQVIEATDSNGNPTGMYNPEQYGPLGTGMDYLCQETSEYTYIYNKYPGSLIAPNPYSQAALIPGQQKSANDYFTALNLSTPGPLPSGFSLPVGFPPPGLTLPSNYPTAAGDIPLSVFGQSDTPSGTAAGVFGFEYTTTTKGLSAQMHCEIEGSRISNMQTAANVIMAVLTIAATAAAIAAIVPGLGWLAALLILLIALIVSAIIYGATWALGSDPNVSGGQSTDTTPNDGVEPVTNNLTLNVGDFIVVLGRWVFDAGHTTGSGSNELHPVKQVYVPTSKISGSDFCSDFCSQYTTVIKGSLTPATINNKNLPQYSYIFHPDVDGCEPVSNPIIE